MVRGTNDGGGEIFRAHQDQPGAHLASCTMGTGSFLGVKRPERGADHPPLLAPRVRRGWSYTSAAHLCLHGHLMAWLSFSENCLFGEFNVVFICELIDVLKINLMLILLFQCLLGFVLCSAREEGYMRTLQWGESLPRLRKYILTAV